MYGKLKTHNFFVTTLDAVINDTDVTGTIVLADKTVNGVTLEDGSYIFWMLVGLNAPTELEIFRIVSVSGKTLTYDKRISPNGIMPHSIGDLAQCNDMGELINFIGDSTQFFGYTETVSGVGNELKVKVLGGTVMDITLTDIIVPDVTLTLADNATNYIYLDDYDNTIKTTTVNPVSYYTISTVVTLSGAITTITDTRVVYSGKMGIPLSIAETARDAIVNPRNGSIIFNDTTGTLNRYEGGEWIDFSFGGTANPRLTEVVEGRARYATTAEFNANLDTGLDGASLVPKVSQVVGGGDVYGPATNSADYIPQWNGSNSKTLKDGLIVPAGGLAGITALNTKQETLVSASNIKSLNGKTVLGTGDLPLPGFVTVGTGKDYTTTDLARAAGHKNLHCYGTLSTSTNIPAGSTIYLAESSVLTYTNVSIVRGVTIFGAGELIVSYFSFYDSNISGIKLTINAATISITGGGVVLTGCDIYCTGYTTCQISGSNFNNFISGNNFSLTSTGAVLIQYCDNNVFDVNGTSTYVTVGGVSNSRIYIDGSSSGNEVRLSGPITGNKIEVQWSSSYILRIESSDTIINGNSFRGQGAFASQACTIVGTGSNDRVIIGNNIIASTVTLNTLDKGTYTGNLIYAQAADVTVTSLTKANNQTGY